MAKWLGGGGSAFYGERVSPWSSLLLVASWGQQAMAPGIPPLEPFEKELSQKNHVVCLLVFYSICVLFLGVFAVHHFIPKFKRRGILTEAFHFYTSDKTSIFLWLALSIFLCFFLHFSEVRDYVQTKLCIYIGQSPLWKELQMIWKSAQYQRFYSCCLHGVLFNMDFCCYWWWSDGKKYISTNFSGLAISCLLLIPAVLSIQIEETIRNPRVIVQEVPSANPFLKVVVFQKCQFPRIQVSRPLSIFIGLHLNSWQKCPRSMSWTWTRDQHWTALTTMASPAPAWLSSSWKREKRRWKRMSTTTLTMTSSSSRTALRHESLNQLSFQQVTYELKSQSTY